MRVQSRTTGRWIARTALGGASMLAAVAIVTLASNSRAQDSTTKANTPVRADDPAAVRRAEPTDVIDAQLEAKRDLLRIDLARAEQAKRWAAYYERQAQDGKVLEDRVLAARDDLLMMEAHIASERADLKVAEIRAGVERRTAPSGLRPPRGIDQANKELDAHRAMLDAKRTLLQVAMSRADRAKRMEAHQEKLLRGGMATEDQVIAAKDDVLLAEAAVVWARASLKLTEARVDDARRLAAGAETASDGAAARLAEMEDRLAVSEMKADLLQHEVGRLRRELPHEMRGTR